MVMTAMLRAVLPETFRLVEVSEVPFAFAKLNKPERLRLVPVAESKVTFWRPVRPLTARLVEVAFVITVFARLVLPVTFKLVEVILPPEIPTLFEFWAAREPRPDTEELGIALPRLRLVIFAVPMFAVTNEEVVKMAWVPVTLVRLR